MVKPYRAECKVLVVDDSRLVRAQVCAYLEEFDFETEQAVNGMQAISMLEAGSYDMVLLDYNMPVLNGKETLAHLRESGNNIPIVMVTAQEDIREVLTLLRMGADDYVPKPIRSGKDLVAVVEKVLQQRDYQRVRGENDKLLAELAEKNAALLKLNTNLEQIIGERTEEIKEKNEMLVRHALNLDRLTRNIAHYLDGPARTIKDLADYIKLDPVEEKYVLEKVGGMDRPLARLAALSRFITSYNGLLHNVNVERDPFDIGCNNVHDVLTGALEDYRIRYQDVTLKLIPAARVAYVLVNRTQLVQMIYCLLDNAIEAMQGQDVKSITVKTVFDSRTRDITITFQDTGPGVDEQSISQIWSPMWSSKGQTGAGLTFVAEFVDICSGSCKAKSSPSGLTIEIVLPTVMKKRRQFTTGGVHIIVLESDLSEIGVANRYIRAHTEQAGYSEDDVESWVFITTELVTNAIEHGNLLDKFKHVVLECYQDERQFHIMVRDQGGGVADSDIKCKLGPEDLFRPRGRGLYAIKQLVTGMDISCDLLGCNVHAFMDLPANQH